MSDKKSAAVTTPKAQKPRAERFSVGFRVVWDDGESYFASEVVNMSESGVFIETTMNVPLGSEVSIIPLVDGAQLFEVRGKVVRELPATDDLDMQPGFGLAFNGLTTVQRDELRRVLDLHRIAK